MANKQTKREDTHERVMGRTDMSRDEPRSSGNTGSSGNRNRK